MWRRKSDFSGPVSMKPAVISANTSHPSNSTSSAKVRFPHANPFPGPRWPFHHNFQNCPMDQGKALQNSELFQFSVIELEQSLARTPMHQERAAIQGSVYTCSLRCGRCGRCGRWFQFSNQHERTRSTFEKRFEYMNVTFECFIE